ncbi:MAG: heavy metal translocating P-type ATPase [Anaerolineae bacterium]
MAKPTNDNQVESKGPSIPMYTKVIPLRAIASNAAECHRCAESLRERLAGSRGIEVAHLNGAGNALILHYDPSIASLSAVEELARHEGLQLEARYRHGIFHVEGLHCVDCADKLERALRALGGVLWVEANYAAATLKLEYDSALVDEAAIVALARRLGFELVPEAQPVLKLKVAGMDCPDCAVHLEEGLRRLEGVAFATVDFSTGSVTVVPRNAVSPSGGNLLEQVKRSVTEAGYSVREEEQRAEVGGKLLLEAAKEEWPVLAAGGLIAGAAILGLLKLPLLADAAFLAAVLIGGFRIARSGWNTLVTTRSLSIDVLMTIAVIGAVAIGEMGEAATVVFLFALGEALEGYTMERARQAIRRLMDLTPRQAVRLRDGIEERVPVASLVPGDIVLVGPGESLPVDGVIVAGESSINEATVTGESVPVAKGVGAEVYGGTVNGMAALRVQVTRPASDSTVARIVRMVEEAQARRAPSQRLVERFARYYTPAVVLLAVVIATLPPLVGLGPFREWLYRSLTLLVLSCPCALVISTPVAVVSAIARAAQQGVVLKGGAYLEALGRVRLLALDKTGTLTSGRPTVQSLYPLNGMSEEELLSLAATLEERSRHPLAAAVVREARRRDIAPAMEVEDMQEVPGQGVYALVAGQGYCAGQAGFVLRECKAIPDDAAEALQALEEQGQTVIAVARQGELLGLIGLQDSLRAEAAPAVRELRRLGLRLLMLTGDNERTAAAIASQAAVDDYRAGLRPEDKQKVIAQISRSYGHVAMVGDGVNDAPALAASSVGIAMGAAGSHATLETADVVLMADDLARLPGIVALGRQTRRTIIANVAFAVIIKLLFLILAVAGLATLWLAVFADVGASLIVILNGMRLLRARV